MRNCFYFICIILVLASCKNENAKNIVIPSEVEVTPILVTDELPIMPPMQMKDVNSHLVFATPGMKHNLLFYDKKSQKTSTWGKLGNGPDDFINAYWAGEKNGKIRLFDSNLRKCGEYELQLIDDGVKLNCLQRNKLDTGSITLLSLHLMDNGMFVGFAGIGSRHLFVLLDHNLKIIDTFGEVPLKGIPEENNLQLYGWFTSYDDKLFFASQPTGYIACFKIDKMRNIKKVWDKFLDTPLYNVETGKWEKENKWGCYDIVANEKYVFAAYSGKNLLDKKLTPQNILVFTHSGKLLKNVKYKDATVAKIALSDGCKIYSMGSDKLMVSDWRDWGLAE